MNRSVFFIGAFVALALGIGLGVLNSGREISITVQIADSMEGVEVRIDDELQGETDPAGRLTIKVKVGSGGKLKLVLSKSHYKSEETVLVLTEEFQYSVNNVTLDPENISMPIEVSARYEDGKIAADVPVFVDGRELGRTNVQGQVTIEVTGPYNGLARIVAEGAIDYAERKILPEKGALSFTISSGLPVEIVAINRVAGVEIVADGRVLGRTGENGIAAISVPINPNGVDVKFQMPGAIVNDWHISSAQMQSGQKLRHEIKVGFQSAVTLNVSAKLQDGNTAAMGYDVSIEGKRYGVTNGSGEFTAKYRPLVGQKIDIQVSRGKEGIGNGSIVAVPNKLDYKVSIEVFVPKVVRLEVQSKSGAPISEVLVRRDGIDVGKTDKQGIIEAKVGKLNVVYQFTFHKNGYSYPARQLTVQPVDNQTVREVILESLHFWATFIDSLNRSPVLDVEVYYDNNRVALTEGVEVQIPIAKIGLHTLELRSSDERYPKKQSRSVTVRENGDKITVYVLPNPITFDVGFAWKSNSKPIANRQVRITGKGFIDQQRTNSNGRVKFANFSILKDQEYGVELQLGQGSRKYQVTAHSYNNSFDFKVDLSSRVHIVTLPGQEQSELHLYRSKADYVTKKTPIHSGTGSLSISDLTFGEYFIVAKGEATVEKKYTITKPVFEDTINTDDPYIRAVEMAKAGKIDEAMDLYSQVNAENTHYHDAQKKLGFYYLQKDDYNNATKNFDEADGAIHGSDPYFYLAAAQANHRAGKYDRGIEFAMKAFTYRSLFQGKERLEKESHAVYIQTLCLHDKYENRQHADTQLSSDDKIQVLKNLRTKWDNYIYNYGKFPRDAQIRLDQVKAWTISL
jgi:tetratricopeptide (TPR) repeat protein